VDLHDHLRLLRKRWRIITAGLLLTIGVAALVTLLSPQLYESRTEFFVSTSGAQDNGQLLQGNTFTQQRVKSYSQLLLTPKVLSPVVAQLGLSTTADELSKSITATVPVDTVLIDVSVTNTQPEQATAIANAIGRQFPTTITELESVGQSQNSPVKVTVVQDASRTSPPVSPKPVRNLALGAVLGVLLGLGLALLRDHLDTRIKGLRDLEGVTEGKTTTTANLGLTLAAAGSRVCLIEADLRRPRLLDYLGYEGGVGLSDVLIGRVQLTEVLQQYGNSSLWMLGAGAIPPNPSELLAASTMKRVVRDLEAKFDYVLIDAPPLLALMRSAGLLMGGSAAAAAGGSALISPGPLCWEAY